jgi:hypothetical protein
VARDGSGNFTANVITANGSALTSLNAANISSGTLAVGRGGTGATTLNSAAVIIGNGTSAPTFVAPGTSGNLLTSNGSAWSSTAPAAPTIADGSVTVSNLEGGTASYSSGGFIMHLSSINNRFNTSTSVAQENTSVGMGISASYGATFSTVLTKAIEIKMLVSGTFRVRFQLVNFDDVTRTISTRFFINGVGIGTTVNTSVNCCGTNSQPLSTDITVTKGDLLQLFVNCSATNANFFVIRGLNLRSTNTNLIYKVVGLLDESATNSQVQSNAIC